MSQTQLILDGHTLTCEALAEAAKGDVKVALDESGVARMHAARALVDQAIERGDAVYGLATGLGARASEVLSGDELAARAGSVQAVTTEIGLSVDIASHHLQSLENRLGVGLMDHNRRPIVLCCALPENKTKL